MIHYSTDTMVDWGMIHYSTDTMVEWMIHCSTTMVDWGMMDTMVGGRYTTVLQWLGDDTLQYYTSWLGDDTLQYYNGWLRDDTIQYCYNGWLDDALHYYNRWLRDDWYNGWGWYATVLQWLIGGWYTTVLQWLGGDTLQYYYIGWLDDDTLQFYNGWLVDDTLQYYNGWGMIRYTATMVGGWHTTVLQWLLSELVTMQGVVRHRRNMILPTSYSLLLLGAPTQTNLLVDGR